MVRPNELPCTVPSTKNRMRVSTPEKRAVGRNVRRFLPIPAALLAVTSHAPTNVGLDVATRGELSDVFDSGLVQDNKTVELAATANARINIRSLHSRQVTVFGKLCSHHHCVAMMGLGNAAVCRVVIASGRRGSGWDR